MTSIDIQAVNRAALAFLPSLLRRWLRGPSTEQVHQWNLPTRPTKTTDSRSKTFEGASVELDAVPADELRFLVRTCIEQHVDTDTLVATRLAEQSEHALLDRSDEALNNLSQDGAS
jgi:hypothetical protein